MDSANKAETIVDEVEALMSNLQIQLAQHPAPTDSVQPSHTSLPAHTPVLAVFRRLPLMNCLSKTQTLRR
jgi:hypothetical protein